MRCTLFNHREAQIQLFRATGNYIKDLGRQGRLGQKQRPPRKRRKEHQKQHQKNARKNTKRTKKKKQTTQKKRKKQRKQLKSFLFFRFSRYLLFFFKAGLRRSRFFSHVFRVISSYFFSCSFPFCVGVLFSSYFFRVHLPLLRWGPVWIRGSEIECLVFCILARMLCRHV